MLDFYNTSRRSAGKLLSKTVTILPFFVKCNNARLNPKIREFEVNSSVQAQLHEYKLK